MSLPIEQMKHLANLAEIELTPAELATLSQDLSTVLTAIDTLQQHPDSNEIPVDTHDIEAQPWRSDLINSEDYRPSVFSQAPQHDAQFYLVPPMIADHTDH